MLTALFDSHGERFRLGHGTRLVWHKNSFVVDLTGDKCEPIYFDANLAKLCEIYPVNNEAALFAIVHFIAEVTGCSGYLSNRTESVTTYELFGKDRAFPKPTAPRPMKRGKK